LPTEIEKLYFGRDFNQPLCDKLPSKIKELTFGYYFNQPINNLPSGLKKLTFTPRKI